VFLNIFLDFLYNVNVKGSGLDPDLTMWDRIRIRILALIIEPISTVLVCVKAIFTSRISVI
jgi:hypothetical protein